MVKRTTIQNIIFDLKRENNKDSQEIIKLLKKALKKERKQIEEAFEEGMKYGLTGMFPHCDYPASRYYSFTFEQEIESFTIKVKIEKTKEGIYWGTTQNISGAVTADGNTLDELKKNLNDAVKLYIETDEKYVDEIYNLTRGFEFQLETKEDFISIETIEEKLLLLNKHAEKLFDSNEDFSKWLNTPNFFFDKKMPSDFLGTISGIQFIDNRLTAMEYGDNV